MLCQATLIGIAQEGRTTRLLRRFRKLTAQVAGFVLVFQLLLSPGFAPEAAAQVNYEYRGPLSSNFLMELTLSGTPAAGTVTGIIRSGTNPAALVRGAYRGGVFTGNAFSGTVFNQAIGGTLSGAVSTPGILTVNPFPLPFNNQTNTVTFTLSTPNRPSTTTPPTSHTPSLQSQNFHSNVGFGYTRVDLTMHFQPNGSMYQVSGQATVHSLKPRDETTTLRISGTYNPQAGPVAFTITGARGPNDQPRFSGSIGANGSFGGQMTGMPSLGITSLYFNAQPQ